MNAPSTDATDGTLDIDGNGVRFSAPKLSWEVRWADIIELGSQTHHLHPEKANFYLCTRSGCHAVPWEWKPLAEVKRSFRAIAERAAGPRVILEDELGWAADLAGDFWKAEGFPDPATTALQSVWHDNVEMKFPLGGMLRWGRTLTVAGAVLLAAILLVAIFLVDSPARIPLAFTLALMGSLCLGVGVFLMIMVNRVERQRKTLPAAIRFDMDAVRVRFQSGEEKKARWATVRRCRMHIPSSGGLVLRLDDGTVWSGGFAPEVAEAVRRTCYAAKLGRPSR